MVLTSQKPVLEPQNPAAPPEADHGLPRSSPPNPVFFNDRGVRAGWRLLAWFAIVCALAFMLLVILHAVEHSVSKETYGDLSRIALVLAVLGSTVVMGKLEGRSPWSYGLSDRRWPGHFVVGALIGWLSLTLMLIGLRAAHHFSFGKEYMHGSALAVAAVLNALSFLFEVALFEEILFRGYVLYTLAEGIRFWPAALVLSIVFAAAHVNNSGEAVAGIIAVVAFGLMLCFSVWRTGSLYWAIGFHFLWDYSESFLYGVPDSGLVSPQHLLTAKFSGPAWITGGSVGPEGSWFIFVVLAGIAVVIHLLYPKAAINDKGQ